MCVRLLLLLLLLSLSFRCFVRCWWNVPRGCIHNARSFFLSFPSHRYNKSVSTFIVIYIFFSLPSRPAPSPAVCAARRALIGDRTLLEHYNNPPLHVTRRLGSRQKLLLQLGPHLGLIRLGPGFVDTILIRSLSFAAQTCEAYDIIEVHA